MSTAAAFLHELRKLPAMPNVFNPWKDYDRLHDMSANAPAIRSDNLERYLAARVGRARFIFTGEAPGHQGAKFSGIAMTSERILLGNKNGITPDCVFVGPKSRSSKEELYPLGANEPTASIAWALLLQLGLAPEEFIFWNSLPTHPHRAGDLLTNRAPKPPELNQAKHLLPLMLSMTPKAQVIAVGRVAQKALGALGVTAACVRHPAMGGTTAFRTQVSALLG